MTSFDVFSCIGCHAIGFERAGIETIAFCEPKPFRRAQIADKFPDRMIYEDVRFIPINQSGVPGLPATSIIIGGPPCQRTSKAAAIHGNRDGESLWPYMLSVGLAVGAEWFVVEQPPGNAPWEAEVGNDLSDAGYEVARIEFGACDVGAPYLRRRVFMVACTSLPRLEVAWSAIPSAIESVKRSANARGDWSADKLESISVDASSAREIGRTRVEWIEALGDSNPPHMAEVVGRAIMAALEEK